MRWGPNDRQMPRIRQGALQKYLVSVPDLEQQTPRLAMWLPRGNVSTLVPGPDSSPQLSDRHARCQAWGRR